MPFKSEAQRRKFYAMQERGEISKSKVDEYEKKTEATQLFSDGARSFVFESWTMADTVTALLAQDGDGILMQDGDRLII